MKNPLNITICRLPYNRISGIKKSAYPLWMGYLVGAIRDLVGKQVRLNVVDGEALDYPSDSILQYNDTINKALLVFFPRFLLNFEQLAEFAENELHPNWTPFINRVLENEPELVAVSCYTNHLLSLQTFARKIKKESPRTKILVGGIHSTIEHRNLVQQIPEIDYCCVGEGEASFREVVSAFCSNRSVEEVSGIYSTQDPAKFVPRPLIEVIDNIEPPVRDLQARSLYRDEFHIFSSRGCPFKCSFCSSHRLWSRTPRFHSVERIMSEMTHIVEDLGGFRIIFIDDTFTLNRPRVRKIANAIVSRGYNNLNIGVCARINTVNESVLDTLAAAGIKSISYGIETGSERLQKSIRKNLKRADIIKILDYTRSLGIHTLSYYIVGHPSESVQDVNDSIELIKASRGHKSSVYAALPLPGTEWFEIASENGFELTPRLAVTMDQNAFPIFNMTAMPKEVLDAKVLEMYKTANRSSQLGRVQQAVDFYWNKIKRQIKKFHFQPRIPQ
jgi:anaerobic magnesium-protoporphyrin IX monomethyl ester cyclase